MDDKDRILLGALAANARESLVGLARRVGLSRSATQERLKRLERNGVVSGYTVKLAASALQDGSRAVIAVTYSPGVKCEDVVPRLRSIPEIVSCESLAGPTDLLVRVACRSNAALEQVREEIDHISGVETARTYVILTTHW